MLTQKTLDFIARLREISPLLSNKGRHQKKRRFSRPSFSSYSIKKIPAAKISISDWILFNRALWRVVDVRYITKGNNNDDRLFFLESKDLTKRISFAFDKQCLISKVVFIP